jgi:hypothetical protein
MDLRSYFAEHVTGEYADVLLQCHKVLRTIAQADNPAWDVLVSITVWDGGITYVTEKGTRIVVHGRDVGGGLYERTGDPEWN